MRFSCIAGVTISWATDHSLKQRSSCVILIQNTPPPVSRTAAARRLTAGTMSRAAGTAAKPIASFTKACCRSMTTSAVCAGSRSAKECAAPRRWITHWTITSGMVAPINFIGVPSRSARRRRKRVDELGVAQVCPQRRWNRIAQKLRVFLYLLNVAWAWEDRRDSRVSKWELQRRGDQRHGMTIACRPDRVDPISDLGWSGSVIPTVAACQNAGIVHRAHDDRNARPLAFWQQIIERVLFEERVPTGQKEGIPVAPIHRFQQHFPFVDANPDRPYQTVTAQLFERPVAAVAKYPH